MIHARWCQCPLPTSPMPTVQVSRRFGSGHDPPCSSKAAERDRRQAWLKLCRLRTSDFDNPGAAYDLVCDFLSSHRWSIASACEQVIEMLDYFIACANSPGSDADDWLAGARDVFGRLHAGILRAEPSEVRDLKIEEVFLHPLRGIALHNGYCEHCPHLRQDAGAVGNTDVVVTFQSGGCSKPRKAKARKPRASPVARRRWWLQCCFGGGVIPFGSCPPPLGWWFLHRFERP